MYGVNIGALEDDVILFNFKQTHEFGTIYDDLENKCYIKTMILSKSYYRAVMCEEPYRTKIFKRETPNIDNVTGQLLYAGTFGWIFQKQNEDDKIVKVSVLHSICEQNKHEFNVSRIISEHLHKINNHIKVEIHSTFIDSKFVTTTQYCYYNQTRILPFSIETKNRRFENLIQILPGKTGSVQERCTGKRSATMRWSEVYDEEIIKEIFDQIGINITDYYDSIAFIHGYFLYFGLHLNDVEFILGCSHDTQSKPQIFLVDFDKTIINISIAKKDLHMYSKHPTMNIDHLKNIKMMEAGYNLASLSGNDCRRIPSPCMFSPM